MLDNAETIRPRRRAIETFTAPAAWLTTDRETERLERQLIAAGLTPATVAAVLPFIREAADRFRIDAHLMRKPRPVPERIKNAVAAHGASIRVRRRSLVLAFGKYYEAIIECDASAAPGFARSLAPYCSAFLDRDCQPAPFTPKGHRF